MSRDNFDEILDENSTNTNEIREENLINGDMQPSEKKLIIDTETFKIDSEGNAFFEGSVTAEKDDILKEYDFSLDLREILLEYDETVKNFQFKNPETGNLITIATAMTYKQKNPSVYMIARVLARKLLNKKIDPKDSGRVNVDKIMQSINSKKANAPATQVPADMSVPSDVAVSAVEPEVPKPTKKLTGKKLTDVNVLDQPITALKSWPGDSLQSTQVDSEKGKIQDYIKSNINKIKSELVKKPNIDSYTQVSNQFNKFNTNIDNVVKNITDPKYASLLMDILKFMSDIGDETAKSLFTSDKPDNNINNYMIELIKNENLKNELLKLISTKFPIKKVLAGQARMKIAGKVVDKSVMGNVFAGNLGEMTQKIQPFKDKSGNPYLSYLFGEKNNLQKVAKIYITDDYANDGNNYKFDMKLYDTFAKNIEKNIIDKDNTETT